jgi:pseudouridine kinase
VNKVLVIGGANLDIKAKTLASHIDGTSNPAHIVTKAGGVARNIAHNLARLGAKVQLVTALGNGPEAEMILSETNAAGVDTRHVIRSSKATGTYIAVLDHSGELVTAVNDMEILETLTSTLIHSLKTVIAGSQYIVADCNLPVETLQALAELCADKLIIEPVSVPKSQKLLVLLEHHEIFLATPNLDQLEALTGTRDIDQGARTLFDLGLSNVIIHAGEQGAYTFDGQNLTHSASQAKTIVDVTGAGDAATAGLIAGLAQNLPLAKAAELGQKAASQVIASESSTLP